MCLKRFLRAYEDAGLLQTSMVDNCGKTQESREDFRRFLVDSHRAAYVPVCIAGSATSVLTVEPAAVVPLNDQMLPPSSKLDIALKKVGTW
eukprot:CAMPEP_0195543234 /NCGR_PEP_ID=MMETSP0794_2-20130614/52013_1 /TAXON_ID=515487 /ORGANISM="Stephanopyxis turris, Strain CCMP 815" /LENGTH=90 /DNA_ID=CAMNT_0040677389 /DNA_START=482 /DNA_END=754 /DNA_ORIENTATION=-